MEKEKRSSQGIIRVAGQRIALHPVDPVRNSRRSRPRRRPHLDETAPRHTAFDPPRALLDKAVGRPPAHAAGEDGGEA
ncbi:MAG TPA: hypothetical protein VFZ09_46475 [Archangium sp.]|uniref:hypothetical protein n=1 Tax=Archangium sp. TaxID=1872627 RepID=UPI002E36EF19|nr:hypothetical protein [Archangium sp.]HEX5753724.1 hypothetical protein [Archangium sp.]